MGARRCASFDNTILLDFCAEPDTDTGPQAGFVDAVLEGLSVLLSLFVLDEFDGMIDEKDIALKSMVDEKQRRFPEAFAHGLENVTLHIRVDLGTILVL